MRPPNRKHGRAVGIALVFLLSCLCFGLAGCSGILSLAAWLLDWSWLILLPAFLLTLLFGGAGMVIWPGGKVHFDRVGPVITLPASDSKESRIHADQTGGKFDPEPGPPEPGERRGQ